MSNSRGDAKFCTRQQEITQSCIQLQDQIVLAIY